MYLRAAIGLGRCSDAMNALSTSTILHLDLGFLDFTYEKGGLTR
jgi:hypothetical protein